MSRASKIALLLLLLLLLFLLSEYSNTAVYIRNDSPAVGRQHIVSFITDLRPAELQAF
jgi:hypothetical protein